MVLARPHAAERRTVRLAPITKKKTARREKGKGEDRENVEIN